MKDLNKEFFLKGEDFCLCVKEIAILVRQRICLLHLNNSK